MCLERGERSFDVCLFVYVPAFPSNKSKGLKGEYTANPFADSAHHMGFDPRNKEQMKVSHFLHVLIAVLTEQQESVHLPPRCG